MTRVRYRDGVRRLTRRLKINCTWSGRPMSRFSRCKRAARSVSVTAVSTAWNSLVVARHLLRECARGTRHHPRGSGDAACGARHRLIEGPVGIWSGDPMGADRRTVTLGCSCGGPQPPRAAGALMRTETSHEAREDQRKSPIGR